MTNKQLNPSRMSGIALLEALIAVVIVSLGMLAMIGFETKLMASLSLSKARSEAIALGEEKQENLRNLVLYTDFSGNVGASSDTYTGVNAAYSRAWKVCDRAIPSNTTTCGAANTLPTKSQGALVSVSWTDPKLGAQSISLASIIGWDNPAVAASLKNGGMPGGNSVAKPTGKTSVGGSNSYTPGSPPTGTGATSHSDGTTTYIHAGIAELINNATGKVLLTSSVAQDFNTIAGRVYIDQVNSSSVSASNVFVLSSDAAYCTLGTEVTVSTKYKYVPYTCYVGPSWFGRVGVVRTDNANTNDRVCLGDPNYSTPVYLTSRQPQLATVRDYRGFKDANGDGTYDTTIGIGYNLSTGAYSEVQNFSRQDFLITRITGSPTDSDCGAKLSLNGTSEFSGNVGKFVCLTAACPTTYPSESVPVTTMTINFTGGSYVNSVSIDGGACTAITGNVATCTIDWTGWIGSTWTGAVTVTPNTTSDKGKICNPGGAITTYPSGSGLDQPTLAGGATSALPNSQTPMVITYSGIPPSVNSMSQTITAVAVAGTCP